MPESYGKRQRSMQKAKKFAAREERRAARKQQKADEAAGITPASSWLGEPADEAVDPQTQETQKDGAETASSEPEVEKAE